MWSITRNEFDTPEVNNEGGHGRMADFCQPGFVHLCVILKLSNYDIKLRALFCNK